jgi:hypothetical protein
MALFTVNFMIRAHIGYLILLFLHFFMSFYFCLTMYYFLKYLSNSTIFYRSDNNRFLYCFVNFLFANVNFWFTNANFWFINANLIWCASIFIHKKYTYTYNCNAFKCECLYYQSIYTKYDEIHVKFPFLFL